MHLSPHNYYPILQFHPLYIYIYVLLLDLILKILTFPAISFVSLEVSSPCSMHLHGVSNLQLTCTSAADFTHFNWVNSLKTQFCKFCSSLCVNLFSLILLDFCWELDWTWIVHAISFSLFNLENFFYLIPSI